MTISDARLRRRNFLYSLPTEHFSAAAAAVAKELKEAANELIATDIWPGFEKFFPALAREAERTPT